MAGTVEKVPAFPPYAIYFSFLQTAAILSIPTEVQSALESELVLPAKLIRLLRADGRDMSGDPAWAGRRGILGPRQSLDAMRRAGPQVRLESSASVAQNGWGLRTCAGQPGSRPIGCEVSSKSV